MKLAQLDGCFYTLTFSDCYLTTFTKLFVDIDGQILFDIIHTASAGILLLP